MPPRIHRITNLKLYFIPVKTRVPLKFGPEILTTATCLRVCLKVVDEKNHPAEGWGETPLSVQWAWPSQASYESRHERLKRFCAEIGEAWMRHASTGHPICVGHDFLEQVLPGVWEAFNRRDLDGLGQNGIEKSLAEPMPWLAALVCSSAFDIALHDAYGRLVGRPVYQTYGPEFLEQDLASLLVPAVSSSVSFKNKYPTDYLRQPPLVELVAWHLVGGLDPLEEKELTGEEPKDDYPIVLNDWIRRDGLKCLKIKLRGNQPQWDYERLLRVGQIALPMGVEWLTADFNCTVQEPEYVNEILDRLLKEWPEVHGRILYVEQPFPYDLERNRIDVHSVAARKPLFLDESAHDWRMIRLGQELGWTGVALKTCKTQTGAILSACWARAHGLQLMVQDLTNPMLAQIPHLLLAAHVETIMGVETNAMQFYPDASAPEAKVHPGIYQRRQGKVDLRSIRGDGFGYRLEAIERVLPEPALALD